MNTPRHTATIDHTRLRYDRACSHCGANLRGRGQHRDERFGLLLVECPSCGRDEPVHAYPPLGPAARWATARVLVSAVAGGLVIIALYALAVILTIVFTVESLDSAEGRVRSSFQQWYNVHHAGKPAVSASSKEFVEWWQLVGSRTFGMMDAPVELDELMVNLIPSTGVFVLGTVISVVLLHRRRWQLALVTLPLLALPLMGVGLILLLLHATSPVVDLEMVTLRLWYLPAVMLGLVFLDAVFILGLLTGRPCMRLLARALLPPSQRRWLGAIWRADGLPPPRVMETVP